MSLPNQTQTLKVARMDEVMIAFKETTSKEIEEVKKGFRETKEDVYQRFDQISERHLNMTRTQVKQGKNYVLLKRKIEELEKKVEKGPTLPQDDPSPPLRNDPPPPAQPLDPVYDNMSSEDKMKILAYFVDQNTLKYLYNVNIQHKKKVSGNKKKVFNILLPHFPSLWKNKYFDANDPNLLPPVPNYMK